MSTLHLTHSAVAAAPALRALWFLGLPLAAGLWAARTEPRLLAAALFGAAAAALIPPAMLETALPVIITHSPGGSGEVAGFFRAGVTDLAVAGLAAAVALLLRRRARAGGRLPQGLLVVLFAGFYTAMIVPRHSQVSDALMPGLGTSADPLAPLALLGGAAPWIAALTLASAALVGLAPRRAA